jgi:hypothetical protein
VPLDGFSDQLDKTTFAGHFVGNLSGLAVDRDGAVLALADRSELFTLDPATLRPRSVLSLAGPAGGPLDSEAIAVDADGTRLITSETEPSVGRYDRAGRLRGRLPVPDALRVFPAGRAKANLTLEALALQPDGRTLVGGMEGPLAGDQPGLVRLPTWVRPAPGAPFAPGPEYGYALDFGLGLSELTPAGDGRLLALQRGFLPGVGNTVHLALVDLAGAADVSGVRVLTPVSDVAPVRSVPLADLGRFPRSGATNPGAQLNPLLDNIEGMTVLGRDPDGALRLLLVSDDNQSPDQVTRLYRLTVRLPPR